MDRHRAGNIKLLVVMAGVIACGGGGGDRADTSSAGPAGGAVSSSGPIAPGGDLRWRNETYRELDGDDENQERLVATVGNAPLESTMVRLEVRTSKDKILYRHEWPAVSYTKYGDPGTATDSVVVLKETERQMGRIFSDSAFILGSAAPGFSGKTDADLDAIRYDIGEHEYRTAKSLKKWDPLPPAAATEIETFARMVQLARIQRVAAETRDRPAFKYYAGGEETYVIAWSPSENRMVRIAACC